MEVGVPIDWAVFLAVGLAGTLRLARSTAELLGGLAAFGIGGGEDAGPTID